MMTKRVNTNPFLTYIKKMLVYVVISVRPAGRPADCPYVGKKINEAIFTDTINMIMSNVA